MDNNLCYKIAISIIPGIGPQSAKKLIAYTGSIEGVFKEKGRTLQKIPGIGKEMARRVTENDVLDRAKQEIEFISTQNITPCFYLDKAYPRRLSNCQDAPLMIYIKGTTNLNAEKIISIVGTRNATPYGREQCENLIADLKKNGHNVTIVSGLAYGIDICAHKAALKNGMETVAVFGHGLETIYPSTHTATARDIITQGALVSDFISNSLIDPKNFVRRNRIIAGLSDLTVVIESGEKGGSLVTADIANSYNRDVMAFPGRVNDSHSIGCNKLIKTNQAALIESANDLECLLNWDLQKGKPTAVQSQLF